MKKLLLLLFPCILALIMIACDAPAVSHNSNGDSDDNSDTTSVEQSNISVDNNVSYSDPIVSDTSTPSDSSSNATTTASKQISGITVTIVGEDTLKSNGFVVDDSFNLKVDVKIEGDAATVDAITAEHITASIDVSNVNESGSVEMMINYTVPQGISFLEKPDFAEVKINKKSASVTPQPNEGAYMSNGIIVNGNRGMETFGGSAASGAKTAEKLNAFKAAVGANVNVYALPCPTASAFYAPEKYKSSITAHSNFFGGIRDNLVDVKFVDTLSALSTHTDEYLYYRTDFHWTGLAGYYAAEALAKVAGTPFDNLSTYTEKYVENCFKGSLIRYASELGSDPDDVYWYEPSREYTVTYYSASGLTNPKTGMSLFSSANGYTKFMHGDTYTAHIKSNVGNGRKLLIFKNSYGNALAPYVLSSFEEVYIADIRKFQENAKEFITEHGITDVCFAMSSHAMAGSTRDYITKLLNY